MPGRDPQTGQFTSGSGGSAQYSSDIHRAHAVYVDDGSDTLHEAAATLQAPDTDRTIVGVSIHLAGDPGNTGEGYQNAEVSFDANAELIGQSPGAGNAEDDDMRSAVLAVCGVRHAETASLAVEAGPKYTPLQATWRRGTELFIHSIANTSDATQLRVIVYYVEN